MNLSLKRITIVITLLLVVAISQMHVGASFAETRSAATGKSVATQPQTTGILTTQGNRVVTVNGADAISGATIVSGASIDTPAGVRATVNLGSLGSVEIAAGSRLTLEFAEGSIKVMSIMGCVTVHANKGTTAEISNSNGAVGKTDAAKADKIGTCPEGGAVATMAAVGGGGALFDLGMPLTLAVFGGIVATGAIVPGFVRGDNPSPTTF